MPQSAVRDAMTETTYDINANVMSSRERDFRYSNLETSPTKFVIFEKGTVEFYFA